MTDNESNLPTEEQTNITADIVLCHETKAKSNIFFKRNRWYCLKKQQDNAPYYFRFGVKNGTFVRVLHEYRQVLPYMVKLQWWSARVLGSQKQDSTSFLIAKTFRCYICAWDLEHMKIWLQDGRCSDAPHWLDERSFGRKQFSLGPWTDGPCKDEVI